MIILTERVLFPVYWPALFTMSLEMGLGKTVRAALTSGLRLSKVNNSSHTDQPVWTRPAFAVSSSSPSRFLCI